MTRGQRIGIAAAAVINVFVLYEVTTSYLAYTADAYVESDLVALAPQITGRIVSVHVTDNQNVVQGDPLATIDPVPFQLTVDQSQRWCKAGGPRPAFFQASTVLQASPAGC